MNNRPLQGVVLVCLGLLGAQLAGQSLSDRIQFHGFGSWAYGQTDGNELRGIGGEHGRWDNFNFALNLNARISDSIRANIQFFMDNSLDNKDVHIDYAFVEYSLSDTFNVRAGRVKQPFGLYGETQKVGTIRPFFTLPQSIYGNAGVVASGYDGIGIVGEKYFKGGWGIDYHFYGGQVRAPFESVDFDSIAIEVIFGETNPDRFDNTVFLEDLIIEDIFGAWVNLITPKDGLSFGFCGYTGTSYSEITSIYPLERLNYYSIHGEYLTETLSIRGEFGHRDQDSQLADIYYLELGWMLNSHWQVAGRYDFSDIDVGSNIILDNFPTLADHEEACLGLNYWFSPSLVFKASFHKIDGNYFAFPEWDHFLEILATEGFEPETKYFLLGIQYSF